LTYYGLKNDNIERQETYYRLKKDLYWSTMIIKETEYIEARDLLQAQKRPIEKAKETYYRAKET
jgi:hypothetical protein